MTTPENDKPLPDDILRALDDDVEIILRALQDALERDDGEIEDGFVAGYFAGVDWAEEAS